VLAEYPPGIVGEVIVRGVAGSFSFDMHPVTVIETIRMRTQIPGQRTYAFMRSLPTVTICIGIFV